MDKSKKTLPIIFFIWVTVVVAACSTGTSTPDGSAEATAQALVATRLAETAQAVTPTPSQTPTLPPANTPTFTPSSTPTETYTPTPTATQPGGGGQIVFVSDRDGEMNLYTMQGDGSGLSRLTRNPGTDDNPIVSPDGQQIIFHASLPGGDFALHARAGDELPEILSFYPGFPESWSQQEEFLTTKRYCIENCQCEPVCATGVPPNVKVIFSNWTLDIVSFSLDNLMGFRLTDDGDMSYYSPAWSPDGSKIAMIGNITVPEIYIMDRDGSNIAKITGNHEEESGVSQYSDLAWSPDGRHLAFTAQLDEASDIFLMEIDGSNLMRITDHPAVDRSPSWSPDGTMLIFESQRENNTEIYRINADGTQLVRLTDSPSEDISPIWSNANWITDWLDVPKQVTEDIPYETEFEQIKDWYSFSIPSQSTENYTFESISGGLYLEVAKTDTTVYGIQRYLPDQTDIRITTSAETIAGPNRNNISLVCRATDQGWYEFSINSGGLWFIWKYETGKGYSILNQGGSTAINLGETNNTFTVECIENSLTFWINEVEVGSTNDATFSHGYFGVSVSTFDIPGSGVLFSYLEAETP